MAEIRSDSSKNVLVEMMLEMLPKDFSGVLQWLVGMFVLYLYLRSRGDNAVEYKKNVGWLLRGDVVEEFLRWSSSSVKKPSPSIMYGLGVHLNGNRIEISFKPQSEGGVVS